MHQEIAASFLLPDRHKANSYVMVSQSCERNADIRYCQTTGREMPFQIRKLMDATTEAVRFGVDFGE